MVHSWHLHFVKRHFVLILVFFSVSSPCDALTVCISLFFQILLVAIQSKNRTYKMVALRVGRIAASCRQ